MMQSFELSVTCGMRRRAGSRLQKNVKLLVQLCHASDYMASTVTKKKNQCNKPSTASPTRNFAHLDWISTKYSTVVLLIVFPGLKFSLNEKVPKREESQHESLSAQSECTVQSVGVVMLSHSRHVCLKIWVHKRPESIFLETDYFSCILFAWGCLWMLCLFFSLCLLLVRHVGDY